MNRKSPRSVTFREYVAEALKNAIYEKGKVLDVVVAEAPDLPGCFTQGTSFEEARENLIDAIEVWIMAGLQSGEELPAVNGCQEEGLTWQERLGKALDYLGERNKNISLQQVEEDVARAIKDVRTERKVQVSAGR